MNKLTKKINSQFNPTAMYANGGFMKQFGLGSWIGDYGKLLADNMLSVVGANNVINDNAYKNKAVRNISKVTNKIGNLTGAIGAAVVPELGGINTIGSDLGTSAEEEEYLAKQQREMQLQQNAQMAQQYLPSYAGGGIIENGGTHEQSPLGGVPVGRNALVEEGEYVWEGPKGKYVFSNRF